jgi:hypothetical protein
MSRPFRISWQGHRKETRGTILVIDDAWVNYSSVISEDSGKFYRSNWRQCIRARTDASNGMLINRYKTKESPWSYTMSFKNVPTNQLYVLTGGGNFYVPTIPSPNTTAIVSSLDAQAQTQFLSKLSQAQTTFHGGEFLGQIREAVHGIRHPLDALQQGFKSYLHKVSLLKRRRGRNSLGLLNKAIAGTYLESVFGWQPLVSDIQDAAKAAARRLNYIPPTSTISTKASKKWVDSTYTEDYIHGNINCRALVTTEVDVSISYKGGFYEKSDYAAIANDFGVSLNRFVPTIWELIPYSFIADYFINIGQCLDALSANTSSLFYVVQGQRISSKRTWVANPSTQLTNTPGSIEDLKTTFSRGSCSIEALTVSRNRIAPSNLSPSLRFKTFGVYPSQLLNSAALLAQSKRITNLFTK